MFGFERVAGAVEGDAEQFGDAVVAETECAFIHAGEAFEFGVTGKQAGVVAEFDGGGEHGGEGVTAFFPRIAQFFFGQVPVFGNGAFGTD